MTAESPGSPSALMLEQVSTFSQVRSFSDLDSLAGDTAAREFVNRGPIPPALAAFRYDDYVKISYKHEKATWWDNDSPFCMETFHQGFVQRDRVWLFASERDKNRLIPFSTDDFNYDLPDLDLDSIAGAGHAGIKLAGRIGNESAQEFLTFLGSSYFRGRSERSLYGASARGLAVNVATDGAEEFPFFRAFWVDQPKPGDTSITIRALLDSTSVAGAYEFILKPGTDQTRVSVKASLHFRRIPEKLAIAPLTSMWIWGDGLAGPPKDDRPACHDSDGLLIRTGDLKNSDWTWRAFSRSPYPSVSTFATDKLIGYGVMQRNTSFFHFGDYNAKYNERPSVFVTPAKNWGAGRVELFELPGAHEGIDNIGAYWIPDQPPTTDKPLRLEYTVDFFRGDHGDESNVARATSLEIDRSGKSIEMSVRFAGGQIDKIDSKANVEIQVKTIRGEAIRKDLQKTKTGDWLMTLALEPEEKAPMEVQATLQLDGKTLSETFVYLCPHQEPEFVYPDIYTR
ncbi:glucan biosynthesis protein [Rubripirellula reticaptiva]|uniref:glucan biosynthesis protein n=1 Tax=Rubripirellula reticaptiva TaxID=2528013 RepID=UPI001FEC03CD|nr:glucan biosynthesis protein [Rubripirellula reticaptiva]